MATRKPFDATMRYNTCLGRAHEVPVHSTIILLRPAADGPDVTGIYEQRYRNGDVYDWFRYSLDASTWDELLPPSAQPE